MRPTPVGPPISELMMCVANATTATATMYCTTGSVTRETKLRQSRCWNS